MSVDAVHDRLACPAPAVAVRFVGAVGGVTSPVTVALASFEGLLRLPAASSATTL